MNKKSLIDLNIPVPKSLPGDTVQLDPDIKSKVTEIRWDGYRWCYSCSYFHNGSYHSVNVLDFEFTICNK